MNNTFSENCLVCGSKTRVGTDDHQRIFCASCDLCGKYRIASTFLENPLKNISDVKKFAIRHWFYLHKNIIKEFDSKSFLDFEKNVFLPSPIQQMNNLIRLIGVRSKYFGENIAIDEQELISAIGCYSLRGLNFVEEHVNENKMFKEKNSAQGKRSYTLSLIGWEKYERLKKMDVESSVIFVARKFHHELLDKFYKTIQDNIEKATGLKMEILSDVLKAGIIDNQLREEIRKCRILLADLTTGNQGAYWEAGYAEGLGTPVIYLCEKEEFEEQKTHFDTNHHTTIKWDRNDSTEAVKTLIATINLTLNQ